MNWCAGFSFCLSHLNSSASADLTGNFLGISLIIPGRCVMHFKELSHHYLCPGRQQYKNHQLLGKGGESGLLFLAFHSSTTSEQAGSSMLWKKGYRKLSSVPGCTAMHGVMWCLRTVSFKISSFLQMLKLKLS